MLSRSQELEIVERCKNGVRSAQFELYQSYSKAMYNICLRMLNNTYDAEDVLQNSFIDVFSKIQTFRGESTIGAWIKRIVINNCINQLSRKKIYVEELNENYDSPQVDEDIEADRLTVERIKKAVQKLPDGYRIVFTLYLMEGYDHKEIGEILNITESTSKTQYSRAKLKIRQFLEKEPLQYN